MIGNVDIPDPLPLRCITVPSGTGCSIWELPPGEAQAAVDDALSRQQEFTDGLNAKLREALAGLG